MLTKRTQRTLAIVVAGTLALLGTAACSKKKKGGGDASAPAAVEDPNFAKPVSASSILEIGSQSLVASKTVRKNEMSTEADPALAVFEAELYPKVRQYCAAGCHDVNQRPFASDAVSLAYEIAKPFMTVNPDDSQMIINIKASHNGTDPAWAEEVGAAITKVAESMP